MNRNIDEINEFLESLIGKSKEEVSEICSSKNYRVRLSREDSTNYVGTCDLRFDRVNIQVDSGIVTKCSIG